ncbi:deoxyribonuclease IV [Candidatus Solirubrobacter pratensis]|uniref:deoxyribonuclease IV n=1 Tax=Candidatus Solirubrobacter pratensis TaxID=1298857 RepID=UPI000402D70E|nr:deoxyribonuclease IV [Candidatus Solirubrobacter pratensis]
MLIGAHVSPAGGPANAVARGDERHCTAIQIFNQSPRQWKGRLYKEEEVAAFREALDGSPIETVIIHAIYLLNPASEKAEFREKSLEALTLALNAGAQLGALGVVLHPGSALKSEDVNAAIKRAGEVIKEALDASEGCDLHLEDTAGAGGTLGRSFEELAALIEASGGGKRLGVCLDTCHLHASGYDMRTEDSVASVVDDFDRIVGLDRLHSLHVNDSVNALGSNRDRHVNLGDGEIGAAGIAAFLSEPRFDGLPAIFEGPGHKGKNVEPEDIENMLALRERGLKARRKG